MFILAVTFTLLFLFLSHFGYLPTPLFSLPEHINPPSPCLAFFILLFFTVFLSL